MSVLEEGVYTVPSRVLGVYNYLIQARGYQEEREKLYQLLSPVNLSSSRKKKVDSSSDVQEISEEEIKKDPHKMIKTVIRECIKMGLLIENEKNIKINPEIDHHNELPSIFASLFLSSNNSENHNFARLIAWYLAQDFYNAPGSFVEIETQLKNQIGGDLFGFNDVQHGQFEDWSCYLGFCWRIRKAVLVPDPTVYIRHNLKNLFQDRINQQISLEEFVKRLGRHCPVFETGRFREEIEQQIGLREPDHLSTVTSMVLRRLEDEGSLKLERLSDAPVLLLSDDSGDPGISHITWLGSKTNGGQL
jgi:hypothetical protein